MLNKDEKEKIEQEIDRLECILAEEKDREYQEKAIPKLKAMVGRCYVYRNNSRGDDNHFDTFWKIIGTVTNKYGSLGFIVCMVQIEECGLAEIRVEIAYPPYGSSEFPTSGRVWCEEQEFNDCYNRAIALTTGGVKSGDFS